MVNPRLHDLTSQVALFANEAKRLRPPLFTDKYFSNTREVINHAGIFPHVTMQVFAKKSGIVCGLAEAIAQLDAHTSRLLSIRSLVDGEAILPWETVLQIKGPYPVFAELETTILGVIARRSLVATNAYRTVKAAGDVPVMFMGARHDDYRVQAGDGYAATVGGCISMSTDQNGLYVSKRGAGTMPHALIAAFGGDTVAASLAYYQWMVDTNQQGPFIVLVDYHNDVVRTSLEVCHALNRKFGVIPTAVRLDTSEKLVDASFGQIYIEPWMHGVNVELTKYLRKRLNDEGFSRCGIVVSGGFNPEKIAQFQEKEAPVTMYGVGSSILGHNNGEGGLHSGFDFTADIVEVDGTPQAKVGRELKDNPRLVTYKE